MPEAETGAVERIARVLAGWHLSRNAAGSDASAAQAVERGWAAHRDEALAVLRTLREPDPAMAAAGDAALWRRMVEAALDDAAESAHGGAIRMPAPAEGSDRLPPPLPGSPQG